MKALLIAIVLVLVGSGCEKKPPVPSNWATSVTRATDPVDPSCTQDHKLTEPTNGEPESLARFGSAVVDDYARLRESYDKCKTWAKGQR